LKEKEITDSPIMEMRNREAVWLAVEREIGVGVVSDVEFNHHPNLRAISISGADIYIIAHITCLVDGLTQASSKNSLKLLNRYLLATEYQISRHFLPFQNVSAVSLTS
jgi:hypothetical protein